MKKDVFKILRCKCGVQKYHAEEEIQAPPPTCWRIPPCGDSPKYSRDWYIKVQVDGKRRIMKVAPQARKAEAVLRQAHDRLFQKRFFLEEVDETPLLSEAVEKVRSWQKNRAGNRALRHIEIIGDIVGDVHLSQIEVLYDQIIEGLEDRGIGSATLNRYRASLKTVLRRNRMPYDYIEMDREESGRIRIITHAEEQAILDLLGQPDVKRKRSSYTQIRAENFAEMADLIPCLIDTGARTSELLEIPWRDIDFKSNLVTFWLNKTDKPRSVPFTKRSREILQRRKELYPERPFSMTISSADKVWKEWIKPALKIDDPLFRLYCTRHTCATRLIANSIDIYRVMKWMGHRSVKTTERYAHLDPELLREAAMALEILQESTNNQRVA